MEGRRNVSTARLVRHDDGVDRPRVVALTAQRVGEWAQRAMGSTIASVESETPPFAGGDCASGRRTRRRNQGTDVGASSRGRRCGAVTLGSRRLPMSCVDRWARLVRRMGDLCRTGLPGWRTASSRRSSPLYAQLLADLISLAPVRKNYPSWSRHRRGLLGTTADQAFGPIATTHGRDLNAVSGPAWVDDAAASARSALLALSLPRVVGHGDFESQNIRWNGRTPYVVHDWDSVISQPEPAIVGAAAAVWPATGELAQAASTLRVPSS